MIDIDRERIVSPYFDVPEKMQYTKLSHSTIYNFIKTGELKRIKMGNKVFFLKSDIEKFVADKIAAASKPAIDPANPGWGDGW